MSALNRFDGIVYLNLAARPDRQAAMRREIARVGIRPDKITRLEAHLDELNGRRGCVVSHLQALDYALARPWDNILILEDDCLFAEKTSEIDAYIDNFFHHFGAAWDVFFLGTRCEYVRPTATAAYVQVLFSERAHAYAVNRPYLKRLKENYLATYESMKNDTFYVFSVDKALDRRWVSLQMTDRWYAGAQPIAFQSASYSDIEKWDKPHR